MLTKEAQTKSVAQKQTEYIYYMLPIQYKAQKQIWSHKTIKYFFYGILQKLFFFLNLKHLKWQTEPLFIRWMGSI